MKKLFTMALCIIMSIGMVACGNGGAGGGGGSSLELTVFSYTGGVGSVWFDNAVEAFERAHAEDVFDNGKVGVKIKPTKTKDHYANNIDLSPYDVVIDEEVSMFDLAASGKLLPITDIVTDTTNGASIESRLSETQRRAYKAINNEYYIIPHYEYYNGLVYDINVFEDYNLYLAANKNNGNNGFVNNKTEQKSVGPNGEPGDYDDGLPATYDEFYRLLDHMKDQVYPFVWSGQYSFYPTMLLHGLLSSYCGANELETMVTLDSGDNTVRLIESFNGDQPVITEKKITPETGYLTKQYAGQYYALSFFKKVVSNSDYYNPRSVNSISNIDAQKLFIDGWLRRSKGEKPTAFLIEGSYWYNEAKDEGLLDAITNAGYEIEERKFGFMPLPGVVSDSAENKVTKPTVMGGSGGMMINANIKNNADKVRIAKEFLKFLNTEQALQEFTVTTGVARNLQYNLTSEQEAELPSYAKTVWNIRKNGDVVKMVDDNEILLNNQRDFSTSIGEGFWQSNVNGTTLYPIEKLKGSVSAKDYFTGMKIAPTTWSDMYGKYFNN